LRRCGSKAKYKRWKKEHIIIYNIKTVHKNGKTNIKTIKTL